MIHILAVNVYYISAVRKYSGVFSCMVSNTAGSSEVVDILAVYVEDVPNVRLTLQPIKPIRYVENIYFRFSLGLVQLIIIFSLRYMNPIAPHKRLLAVKF